VFLRYSREITSECGHRHIKIKLFKNKTIFMKSVSHRNKIRSIIKESIAEIVKKTKKTLHTKRVVSSLLKEFKMIKPNHTLYVKLYNRLRYALVPESELEKPENKDLFGKVMSQNIELSKVHKKEEKNLTKDQKELLTQNDAEVNDFIKRLQALSDSFDNKENSANRGDYVPRLPFIKNDKPDWSQFIKDKNITWEELNQGVEYAEYKPEESKLDGDLPTKYEDYKNNHIDSVDYTKVVTDENGNKVEKKGTLEVYKADTMNKCINYAQVLAKD
jgi:hypothetical protein